MTGDKGIPSIGIAVKYFFRDGSGVAYQSFSKNVDWIDKPSLLFGEDSIENFEYLSSN